MKRDGPRRGDVVLIEWIDAETSHGWEDEEKLGAELFVEDGDMSETVGFYYGMINYVVTVADKDNQWRNNRRSRIPKELIRKITVLKRATAARPK